jgi:ferredoxin
VEATGAGRFVWSHDSSQQWVGEVATLYPVDADAADPAIGGVGPLRVVTATPHRVELEPIGELSDAAFDRLLIGGGRWTMLDAPPDRWPDHHTANLAAKERWPAELFLTIDPLVSLSTAVASRSWVWSLACAGIILLICVFIPRGFCGYLCPLGTVIDLFDWSIGSRVKRFRVGGDGWWVHLKYYILLFTLVCALFGVLVSGYVSAIPVITRAMLFLGEPLQNGALRGWHQVPGFHLGHWISIALFLAVLGLGFLKPRFWCKYVCPSGAVFSLGNLFRATERKVESSCIHCNRCVEICPFDAIKPDFTTRTTDCTFCQTCGGVCPVHSIKFVPRGDRYDLKVEDDPATGETALGRRGFLSLAAGVTAATGGGIGFVATTDLFGAQLEQGGYRPVRPPGSVPEREFLQMCIRCGECFKACPNNVLQAEGFEQGIEGLWTPLVNADWAGCESSCNACGQVCPTGAIRSLPLEEKRVARMGLAIVNPATCLPLAGEEACQLCVDECNAAGYEAIEFTQVHVEVDDDGRPVEGSGFLAPLVIDDRCVGCGLCQTRCYAINHKERGLLSESAIVIEAGEGKEDRLMSGSYRALREAERAAAGRTAPSNAVPGESSDSAELPSQVGSQADEPVQGGSPPSPSPAAPVDDPDPFGLGI